MCCMWVLATRTNISLVRATWLDGSPRGGSYLICFSLPHGPSPSLCLLSLPSCFVKPWPQWHSRVGQVDGLWSRYSAFGWGCAGAGRVIFWSVVVHCCSVAQSCVTLCNPKDCSTPAFPNLHHLLKSAQTHVHWISDAIQPSHPLSSPSPPAFNLSQHWDLFQWVSCSHQVAKVLELQLRLQSSQWTFRLIPFRTDGFYLFAVQLRDLCWIF